MRTLLAVFGIAGAACAMSPVPAESAHGQRTFLNVRGHGIATSRWFRAPGQWQLHWWYSCRSLGKKGTFIVRVDNANGGLPDAGVVELGRGGSGIEHEHRGGRYFLHINSECQWRVWLTKQ